MHSYKWNRLFDCIAIVAVSASYFTFLLNFAGIYLAREKTGIVRINAYGEADTEIILMLSTMPFVLRFFWKIYTEKYITT